MDDHIELLTVLKELHHISGFRISVHDTKFNEIAAYPKELGCFCSLVQQNEKARQICIHNDIDTFNIVRNELQTYVYQCKFGLYEAVAPLFSFGTLTGYLMMGQSIDTLTGSRDFVYKAALPYVKDLNVLSQTVGSIPVSSKEMILSCITIMDVCAKYITLSNRLHLSKQNLTFEIKKYIAENYHKKITIAMLCEQFFCSRSTLINSFKKNCSTTISQYILDIRMEKAEEMLKNSNKSIKDIAVECGFEDQNYFSKVFHKSYKKSPSEYRK
ncbi:MAG: soxS 1 [Caproiciproducens sp.]|nr:soxS 1 [Caproiciproducens sp.]